MNNVNIYSLCAFKICAKRAVVSSRQLLALILAADPPSGSYIKSVISLWYFFHVSAAFSNCSSRSGERELDNLLYSSIITVSSLFISPFISRVDSTYPKTFYTDIIDYFLIKLSVLLKKSMISICYITQDIEELLLLKIPLYAAHCQKNSSTIFNIGLINEYHTKS